MNKAIFLDRDGVLNEEIGRYVSCIEEFIILPDVIESLKILQQKGYLLIVITNQGGIAKRLYNEHILNEIHSQLKMMLEKEGVKLTEIYYCPHHPEFSGNCLCRKPGSLLLEKAMARFNIDRLSSYFIGDNIRDVEAGESAGVKCIKIESNSSLKKILTIIK
jgi:D-glycero-D-manno-heptose 1,7-bisphosphate phosphatase